jgi:hypothetical protein
MLLASPQRHMPFFLKWRRGGSLDGSKCCILTRYQAVVLTDSVIATAHRRTITVSKADADIVSEMHRLIKGQDIGGKDSLADAVAVGEGGASSGRGKPVDYMEDARRASLRRP